MRTFRIGTDPKLVVLYVHGYGVDVDSAIVKHDLEKQFRESGVSAVFVVVDAPSSANDDVRWPSLLKILTKLGVNKPVVAIGHSGAYRTIAKWLRDPLLKGVVLLDGLYGHIAEFTDFARRGDLTLVTIGTGTPHTKSLALAAGVPVRHDVTKGQTHTGLVASGKFIPAYVRHLARLVPGASSSGHSALLGLVLAGLVVAAISTS